VILIPSAVIWDTVDGNVVLCNLDSGKHLELNQTGGLIWDELRMINQMATLVKRVEDIYPQVPTAQLRQDLETFVAKLLREDFLESAPD
jgi:hypothetical protein